MELGQGSLASRQGGDLAADQGGADSGQGALGEAGQCQCGRQTHFLGAHVTGSRANNDIGFPVRTKAAVEEYPEHARAWPQGDKWGWLLGD
jgi:hypothetical protein